MALLNEQNAVISCRCAVELGHYICPRNSIFIAFLLRKMIKQLITLVSVSVGSLLSAQAQTTTAPSAKALSVRDSVFAQVAAVRLEGSSRVTRFKSHHFAIRGLRTVTKSYMLVNNTVFVLAKKHVVKHKTTGALVEKVTYFNRGQKQFREEYQNGHLAKFTFIPTPTKESPKEIVEFVQGDYLSITRQFNPLFLPKEQKPAREFYHYPTPPVVR
ncbi:hypothetical protein [Hymenobacter fodinae]|uniref:Uncharacterized protein n=1 Tax=Hymenobacter fodinae TaxID=2510796 RepID=A0A4Z0P9E7_9BACT|nr:hypothetical protein [Hymenobacter fodinae]TGE09287.1 hypothetical protein EU556_00170 [Hymenobacter fodinae]